MRGANFVYENEILAALKKSGVKEPKLEAPPDRALGDWAFACFLLAKEWKKSPVEIAKELAKKIKVPSGVEKVVANGPYLNFYLKDEKVAHAVITKIAKEKDKFGKTNVGKEKTIAIEFSSPNIAKSFHYGHLRSTVIGHALYLLFSSQGYKVLRLNHLGDWGTQFGAVLAAYRRWGKAEELKKDPIRYLVELYQKFHDKEDEEPTLHDEAKAWFKKLEENDAEAMKLWAKFKHLSLDEFRRIYALLGIEFDSYDGESFYTNKIDHTIELIEKKKLAKLDEGALIVSVPGLEVPCMLRKSDGTSTYASRDLAALKYRVDTYKPDRILYVVAADQGLHFKQIFGVARQMGWKVDAVHVPFGLYLSAGGGKMSTRRGKTVLLNEVLEDVITLARETVEKKNPKLKNKDKIAKTVGVGAVLFGDLANDRVRDIEFDEHKILDFEGNTGPYLQYTHARACSIIRKAAAQKLKPALNTEVELLAHDSEVALIRLLAEFHDAISQSVANVKPHILAQHLLQIGRAFNEFYHACPVLQEECAELKQARLLLVDCSRQVLKNGLGLLGITAPEEM